MTSTSSRPVEPTPPAPTFSYAQAAKGRNSSATPSGPQATQNSSGFSTPHKDATTTTFTSAVGSEKDLGSVNGGNDVAGQSPGIADVPNTDSKEVVASKNISNPTSPSFGSASTATLPRDDKDDDFVLVGHSEHTKERHSHQATDRTGEEKEGRRSKKGKKQKSAEKEAEKEKEEVKQENLVPAPIPTINYWQQRKEDAAKSKPVQATGPASQIVSDTTALKSNDSKQRAKEDGSKSSHVNGLLKDLGKGMKKSSDGVAKVKDEQLSKRSGPRGSRAVTEKEESQVISQLPPPVEDSISWPTPETALEEDKRKAQEKSEKEERDEPTTNKPRPKEKWVAVPYIPTVTFNTPLPTRGARGRGGARGGRTDAGGRSGTVNGEKSTTTGANPSASAEGRPSREPAARATSLPPVSSKQQNEQSGSRNGRKVSGSTLEKAKNDPKMESISSAELRNNPDVSGEVSSTHLQDMSIRDQLRGAKQDNVSAGVADGPLLQRSTRHSDAGLRSTESHPNPRERVDGRSDRGRGGFRGRGGHNGFPNGQHSFTNGHPPQPPNGYTMRQNGGPYSPPIQPPFGNQYPSVPSRNGRNGNPPRSQSIANGSLYGRHYGQAQHVSALQTSNPVYDYSMQPMSAGPYNPYVDSASVIAMVVMQLDYYFSIDNLCKDVYLRKHMDSQGFVFLSFIAGFKRIQSLTQDYELLKAACIQSDIIESVKGDDGHERLRRKEGWEKWVMVVEERDEGARHAGPTHTIPLIQAQRMLSIMVPGQYGMPPQQAFSPNGTDHIYRPLMNGGSAVPTVNGNGTYHPETPLSAAVPDFAPGVNLLNGDHDPLESEITFSDDEVLRLFVVNRPKTIDESKPKSPFHTFAARTFSNGSIDDFDDGRQGRTLTNGTNVPEASPEDHRRSRSPFTSLSPTKSPTYNGPPVMWVKGQQQQPLTETDNGELYTSLRSRALKRRENSKHGETHQDMQVLYEFWSHFLVRNFNLTMYHEFRQCAFEDSRREAAVGMSNLIAYYDEVLNSKKKVIPEALARHYVEIVSNEEGVERPAFQKLRAAWRNGALDLKSRKKIDALVDVQLREELELGLMQRAAS